MTAIAWRRHARFREGGNLPKCVVLGLDDSSLERSMYLEESNIGRRDFLKMTGARTVAASAGPTATQALASNQSADSEFSGGIVLQPGSAVAQT